MPDIRDKVLRGGATSPLKPKNKFATSHGSMLEHSVNNKLLTNLTKNRIGDIRINSGNIEAYTELRAENQSGWDMVGNALAQTAGEIIGGGIEGIGNIIGLIHKPFDNNPWFERNAIESLGAGIMDWTREEFPIYQRKIIEQGDFATRLGDWSFWATLLPSALGSAASIMVPAAVATKGLSAVARLTTKALTKSQKAATLFKLATEAQKAKAIVNANKYTQLVGGAVVSRYLDSSREAANKYIEAKQWFNDNYKSFAKHDSNGEYILKEDGEKLYLNDASSIASAAEEYANGVAARGFRRSVANIAFDLVEWTGIMRAARSFNRKTMNQLKESLSDGFGEVATKRVMRQLTRNNKLAIAKNLGIAGLGAVSEAADEAVMSLAMSEGEYITKRKYGLLRESEIMDWSDRQIKNLMNPDTLTEALGGLLGGTLIQSVFPAMARKIFKSEITNETKYLEHLKQAIANHKAGFDEVRQFLKDGEVIKAHKRMDELVSELIAGNIADGSLDFFVEMLKRFDKEIKYVDGLNKRKLKGEQLTEDELKEIEESEGYLKDPTAIETLINKIELVRPVYEEEANAVAPGKDRTESLANYTIAMQKAEVRAKKLLYEKEAETDEQARAKGESAVEEKLNSMGIAEEDKSSAQAFARGRIQEEAYNEQLKVLQTREKSLSGKVEDLKAKLKDETDENKKAELSTQLVFAEGQLERNAESIKGLQQEIEKVKNNTDNIKFIDPNTKKILEDNKEDYIRIYKSFVDVTGLATYFKNEIPLLDIQLVTLSSKEYKDSLMATTERYMKGLDQTIDKAFTEKVVNIDDEAILKKLLEEEEGKQGDERSEDRIDFLKKRIREVKAAKDLKDLEDKYEAEHKRNIEATQNQYLNIPPDSRFYYSALQAERTKLPQELIKEYNDIIIANTIGSQSDRVNAAVDNYINILKSRGQNVTDEDRSKLIIDLGNYIADLTDIIQNSHAPITLAEYVKRAIESNFKELNLTDDEIKAIVKSLELSDDSAIEDVLIDLNNRLSAINATTIKNIDATKKVILETLKVIQENLDVIRKRLQKAKDSNEALYVGMGDAVYKIKSINLDTNEIEVYLNDTAYTTISIPLLQISASYQGNTFWLLTESQAANYVVVTNTPSINSTSQSTTDTNPQVSNSIRGLVESLFNKRIEFDAATHTYTLITKNPDGSETRRVADLTPSAIGKDPNAQLDTNTDTPATRVGTWTDELLRYAFGDSSVDAKYVTHPDRKNPNHTITVGDNIAGIAKDIVKRIKAYIEADIKSKNNSKTPVLEYITQETAVAAYYRNSKNEQKLIAGMPDLIVYDSANNKIYVYDFKTVNNVEKVKNDTLLNRRHYIEQVRAYSSMLNSIFNDKGGFNNAEVIGGIIFIEASYLETAKSINDVTITFNEDDIIPVAYVKDADIYNEPITAVYDRKTLMPTAIDRISSPTGDQKAQQDDSSNPDDNAAHDPKQTPNDKEADSNPGENTQQLDTSVASKTQNAVSEAVALLASDSSNEDVVISIGTWLDQNSDTIVSDIKGQIDAAITMVFSLIKVLSNYNGINETSYTIFDLVDALRILKGDSDPSIKESAVNLDIAMRAVKEQLKAVLNMMDAKFANRSGIENKEEFMKVYKQHKKLYDLLNTSVKPNIITKAEIDSYIQNNPLRLNSNANSGLNIKFETSGSPVTDMMSNQYVNGLKATEPYETLANLAVGQKVFLDFNDDSKNPNDSSFRVYIRKDETKPDSEDNRVYIGKIDTLSCFENDVQYIIRSANNIYRFRDFTNIITDKNNNIFRTISEYYGELAQFYKSWIITHDNLNNVNQATIESAKDYIRTYMEKLNNPDRSKLKDILLTVLYSGLTEDQVANAYNNGKKANFNSISDEQLYGILSDMFYMTRLSDFNINRPMSAELIASKYHKAIRVKETIFNLNRSIRDEIRIAIENKELNQKAFVIGNIMGSGVIVNDELQNRNTKDAIRKIIIDGKSYEAIGLMHNRNSLRDSIREVDEVNGDTANPNSKDPFIFRVDENGHAINVKTGKSLDPKVLEKLNIPKYGSIIMNKRNGLFVVVPVTKDTYTVFPVKNNSIIGSLSGDRTAREKQRKAYIDYIRNQVSGFLDQAINVINGRVSVVDSVKGDVQILINSLLNRLSDIIITSTGEDFDPRFNVTYSNNQITITYGRYLGTQGKGEFVYTKHIISVNNGELSYISFVTNKLKDLQISIKSEDIKHDLDDFYQTLANDIPYLSRSFKFDASNKVVDANNTADSIYEDFTGKQYDNFYDYLMSTNAVYSDVGFVKNDADEVISNVGFGSSMSPKFSIIPEDMYEKGRTYKDPVDILKLTGIARKDVEMLSAVNSMFEVLRELEISPYFTLNYVKFNTPYPTYGYTKLYNYNAKGDFLPGYAPNRFGIGINFDPEHASKYNNLRYVGQTLIHEMLHTILIKHFNPNRTEADAINKRVYIDYNNKAFSQFIDALDKALTALKNKADGKIETLDGTVLSNNEIDLLNGFLRAIKDNRNEIFSTIRAKLAKGQILNGSDTIQDVIAHAFTNDNLFLLLNKLKSLDGIDIVKAEEHKSIWTQLKEILLKILRTLLNNRVDNLEINEDSIMGQIDSIITSVYDAKIDEIKSSPVSRDFSKLYEDPGREDGVDGSGTSQDSPSESESSVETTNTSENKADPMNGVKQDEDSEYSYIGELDEYVGIETQNDEIDSSADDITDLSEGIQLAVSLTPNFDISLENAILDDTNKILC